MRDRRRRDLDRNEADHARALKADRIAQLEKIKAGVVSERQLLKMTIAKPKGK